MHERSIFMEALAKDSAGERSAYLEQACGADAALRRRLEALLHSHEQAGNFLGTPIPERLAEKRAISEGVEARPGKAPGGDEDNSPLAPGPLAAAGPAVAERPGTLIGPYQLLRQIGEGGMGTVFLAEQTRPMQRQVALKVVKPGMDSRQVIARFEAERQALALMDHVNIARVLDAGATASGRPYFVMELVHGVPITQYCDDNRLTPRQRLELFVPVCQAIQHAHQKGIIHRDVKPSNVLITLADGKPVPKVIDFGVAKATEQRLTERTLCTQDGTLVGTLEYMSPEQAELSALGVDTRSDIYSLGVLLYELLTGSTPLSHERLREAGYAEVLRMIKEEEPPRPSQRLRAESRESRARGLPALDSRLSALGFQELDWIVMKCLEKDRNRRYQTANGFAADVQRYLNDEAVEACPPSAWYRFRKLVRRRKGPVLAAALVVLALVGGIIGTTWGMLRATEAQADAVNEAKLKDIALRDKGAALAAAQRSKRDADEKLLDSYLAQARAFRLSRRSGQRFDSLDVLKRATDLARALGAPAEKLHELRNAVIASLALPDLRLTGPGNPWPADAHAVDFDEAHTLYARTDRQGNCSVRRVADDAELHRLPGLGGPASPHLSRDGKFLVVQHNRKDRPDWAGGPVQLWTLDEAPARLMRSEANGFGVAFHPGGRQVGLTYTDGAIRLFKLPGGRPLGRPLAPDTLTREVGIALHPTEPLVAVCSYFGQVVQIRDVRTGEVVASLPQSARVTHAAWHPDGRTLAVGHPDPPRTRLYDRTTRQPYRTLEGGGHLTFNHAGDRLATRDWSAALGLFDVGTGQRLFAVPPGAVAWRFSRDDRRLAGGVQDGKLGAWQVGDGREYRTLIRTAPPAKVKYQAVALNPDGRWLACGMSDGFGLWGLATGSELAFLPLSATDGGVRDVCFEPSGALLTAGFAGLLRWPVRANPEAPHRLLVGPPERLLPRAGSLGQSADGRVIVACNRAVGQWQAYAGAWVLHAERPGDPIRLDAGADIFSVAVSPDGRWVVTVTLVPGRAKIWDARDGRLVKPLAEWWAGQPRFSPDGRWLSTAADGGRLYAVGSWEPGPRVGAGGAFAPDSRLMAVQPTTGAVRLVDRVTGRELARLENPDSDSTTSPLFTPDGARLIGLARGICVWDLRLIRRYLKPMGLDWEYPEFRPPAAESRAAGPPEVRILSGDLREPPRTREQEAREAIARWRRAVEADPGCAKACNNLAWAYLTAPGPLRDVKAALPLAEKAVRLAPGTAHYRNTLGVAYYRGGRFREAATTLRPNLDKQDEQDLAFDLYFLAMSYHRLGESARARDYLAWAVRWHTAQRGLAAAHLEELKLFRTEAEQLLGTDHGP